ncbi:MAG: FAD-dependent oxidoreductase [Pseudomonadota bacterium]
MEHVAPLTGPDFTIGVSPAELAEDVPLLGHAGGKAIVMVRTGGGIRALAATCSHYGGPLAEGLVVGQTLHCPWHHACFDLQTGEAVGAPALSAIACYEVGQRGGRVVVGPRKPAAVASQGPIASPASIVIVGAGAAGAAAAERLRALGYTGPVALIGNEPPGPVDRPNLSKDYLAGTAPAEWVSLRPPDFYRSINVDLRIDDPAVSLDPVGKTLVLQSGQTLAYDSLLLATGAEPSRLPIAGSSLQHVFTLRSLADANAIIAAAQSARHVVVIGSSFIGLEVAAALRARGLEVDVVSRDHCPLQRVLGISLGEFVRRLHEMQGVHFHLGKSPRAIHPQAVELDDGRVLAADLVVLGVGVRPRVALAESAGLRVADGILVDARLRTSAADIWAAGDVARYPEARQDISVRIEHWVLAQRQGQAVARDMLGMGSPFRDVPFFWSQHYDVMLAYVGHANADDTVEVIGSLAERNATVIYRRDARLVAIATIGRDRQSLAVEAALEREDAAGIESAIHDFG